MKRFAQISPITIYKNNIRYYKYLGPDGYYDNFSLTMLLIYTRPNVDRIMFKMFDTKSSDIMLVVNINNFERL